MDMGDGQRSLDDISQASGKMLDFSFHCIEEELFVGEGEVNVMPTSAKQEAEQISNRIIFQKDLFETLFALYDGKKCGQVRCSELLELIKVTMRGDYNELELMLDPMGCDMPVDLETFRTVMLSWEGRQINSPYASSICTDYSPRSSSRDFEQRHGLDVSDMSFPSSESSPLDAKHRCVSMDPEGLENEIAQLRFDNKKLAKENENLEIQVLKLESRNAYQQRELQSSQNRIQSLQNSLQECEDDFHKAVCRAEESASSFHTDMAQLKAEKCNLELQLKLLKDELAETNNEMLCLRSSEENFRVVCEEQQVMMSETTERAQHMGEKLSQKTEECSQFRGRLLEVLRTNEQLRRELREREEEVLRLHEVLCENEISKFGAIANNDNDSSAQLDVTMEKTFYVSTPVAAYQTCNSSIYTELMDSLSDESFSQPICGKVPEEDDVMDSSEAESTEADILTSLLSVFYKVNSQLKRVNAELLEKHPLQEVAFDFGKMAPKESETQASSAQQPPESVDLTTKLSSTQLHDIWAVGLADLDGASDTSNPESQRVFLTSGSTESLKDQISKEVKMLRLQVAKSQAILSSLQAKGHKLALSSTTTSSGRKRTTSHSHHSSIEHPNTLLDYDVTLAEFSPERSLHMMSQQSTFLYRQAKMLNRFYTLAPTSGSQSSTPLHTRRRTKSCPILPSQTASVTKATQTEPMDATAMLGAHQSGVCPVTESCLPNNSPRKRAGLEPLAVTTTTSALRSTMSASVAPPALAAMAELEPSDEELSSSSPLVILRNRTYSFSQAIQSAGQEDSPEFPQRHVHVPVPSPLSVSHPPESDNNNCQNGDDAVSNKLELHENGTQASLLENNEDYRLTSVGLRKLSILHEEDHEDSVSESAATTLSKSPPTNSTVVPLPNSQAKAAPPPVQPVRPPPTTEPPSVSVSLHSSVLERPLRFPPPYRPPPPPPARAYWSSENLSHSQGPPPSSTSKSYESLSRPHFPPLPSQPPMYHGQPLFPPLQYQRLSRPLAPIRQSSDPSPCPTTNQSSYLSTMVYPYQSTSAQSLNYHDTPSSLYPPDLPNPFFRSSSDPTSSGHPTSSPCPPSYRPPPAYRGPPPLVNQGSLSSERELSPSDSFPEREMGQGDNIYQDVVSTKKKPLGELHPDRQKKTGLVISPKDYQLPESTSSKCDPDEDSDEDERRITSRGSSRRRRRSFGSPASSPAIQRSKAIDFEFEEESEAQQAQLLIQKPLPKKDDSDVDVKRDILEGMSQAASRAASELASSPPTVTRSPDAREPKLRRRPGESGKSRLLMPELMENSETESAKGSGGSMESEADPTTLTTSPAAGEGTKTSSSSSPAAVVAPPAPTGDGPFPSLPDSFLKKLGLHKDNKDRTEHLSEGEVDTKFNSLCLAFKTDRFTLGSRLELHQRQRDLAEKNIDDEIIALKENLNALSQICADEETRELVKRLHHHLDVLHQSTARMSSRAEVYGAVQQEERTSRAIEVMLMYVENAKRLNEKTMQELEDMKSIVVANNLLTEESSEADDGRRTHRTFSMSSVGVGKPGSRRRASIAALPRSTTERLDNRPKGANLMLNSRNSVCNIGARRCPVQYNLRPFPTADQMNPSEKVRKHSMDVSYTNSNGLDHNENERISYTPVESRLSNPIAQTESNRPSSLPSTPTADEKEQVMPEALEVVKNGVAGSSESDFPMNGSTVDSSVILSDDYTNGEVPLGGRRSQCVTNWPEMELIPRNYDPSPLIDDYSDEDGDLEDEQVENVPSPLSKRMRPSRSQTSVFSVNHWFHNSSQTLHSLRYAVGGILFVAALISLLMTFMTGATSSSTPCGRYTPSWYSIEEMIRPHVTLRHNGRPPI